MTDSTPVGRVTVALEDAGYQRIAGGLQVGELKFQFLAAFALAALVWVATREALQGRVDAGQFMTLMSAMMAIIPSLRRITSVQTQISRGVAAAERLFGIPQE